MQRLRFAPQLFRAAGFAGWCVLLDEVELIGRYTPLQRGRSYAEAVRWLGLDRGESIAGMFTVAAVTDDFADQMFAQRRDDELIPPRLEQRGLARSAVLAKVGIDWLSRNPHRLRPPDDERLRRTLDQVVSLYRSAYDWSPPVTEIGERLAGKSMRQYVKSWITAWDIQRLYDETPGIQTGTIATDYEENIDMEQAPPEADPEDGES